MEKSRYGSCSSHHGLLLALLFFLLFEMSMARVQPLQLNKAQESTMRNLSSMVSAMAPWSNWNTTDSNPCLWSGVTCSVPSKRPGSSAVVLHLSMSRFGLSNSTILACLCSLDTLESLDLSQNRFTDLPRQFSSCPLGARLRTLNLSYAQLPGPLGDFTRFRKLEVFDFSFSLLSGNVNKQLSSLPRLRSLNLSSNNLDGGLPTNMVHSLKELVLSGNSFSGLIPSGITMNTEMLDLSYNKLSGEIPSDLFLVAGLHTVDLTGNMLEGPIPRGFSRSLYRLCLGGNLLNGSIPGSIGDASSLSYLELDNNYLTGGIPRQVGRCSKLVLLDLASNQLNGAVPTEIGKLDSLAVLKLQMNNFDGHIPSTLVDLVNLNVLNLSQNSFTGEIPQEIFQLPRLSNVNLQVNKITGDIPTSISSSQSLIELNLGDNDLTGVIPTMPTSLSAILNLSHNHLSGSIPSNIGVLKDLEILDLSYNDLSGPIPSSLEGLQSLTQVVLSYNQLSGSLPAFRSSVAVDSTGNPDLLNNTANASDVMTRTEDHSSAIWVAAVSFVVGFVVSFYGDGIRNGWLAG
ncbi:LRR receptor-like serine/threonine-protein kinase RGI2 [Hordeum vulgare subsp. vulgare]|uniref:Leucine-rich repeat-containing N-terminal plant-type domain-containing protein n=1 Tax=Hordeum vulgare subsp. vulgare TaxID=112509 RepID=A0A8I6Y5H9_HORVV|nr:LRR receptor-like serine/threonine-protein kinase RGI2 [Hordeum vulgare subsp. vulgare]